MSNEEEDIAPLRSEQKLSFTSDKLSHEVFRTRQNRHVVSTDNAARRRKLSVPALHYSSRLSTFVPAPNGTNDVTTNGAVPPAASPSPRYRRFSNVGDAVSRKLSTTIGWRSVISVQDIINQAKSLCGQYIKARLKRSGVVQRKLGLQRMRSLANLPGGILVCEIFSQLHVIGLELERMNPKLYVDVCKQVAVTITNEKSVRGVLSSIAQDLLKADITWGKIISLYCVAGGLAVDCVHHGHPEYLFGLIDAMALVVERDAASWIASQGGWAALLSHHRPPDDEASYFQMIALSVVSLIVTLVALIFLLRLIGNLAMG